MKVRQGFVSNSSSSSFILPVKKKNKIEITVADLIDAINSSGDSGVDATIDSEEGIKEYLLDQYGSRGDTFEKLLKEDEWVQRKYETITELLRDSEKLLIGSVDNYDSFLYTLIKKFGGEIDN